MVFIYYIRWYKNISMDKKLVGNFIIYFPPIAYTMYILATLEKGAGINWTAVVITGIISVLSNAVGKYVKNKDEVE